MDCGRSRVPHLLLFLRPRLLGASVNQRREAQCPDWSPALSLSMRPLFDQSVAAPYLAAFGIFPALCQSNRSVIARGGIVAALSDHPVLVEYDKAITFHLGHLLP